MSKRRQLSLTPVLPCIILFIPCLLGQAMAVEPAYRTEVWPEGRTLVWAHPGQGGEIDDLRGRVRDLSVRDPGPQDGMALGHIGAPGNYGISVFDVIIVTGRFIKPVFEPATAVRNCGCCISRWH